MASDFEQRLLAINPALVDFNYAGEAYDAVVILALAGEQAKSTKGVDMASAINGITKDGEKSTAFAACKAIITRGADIDDDGVSGPLDFTPVGEPGSGSYGKLRRNAQNRIDDAATTFAKVDG